MTNITVTRFERPNGKKTLQNLPITQEDKDFLDAHKITVSIEENPSFNSTVYFDYGKTVDNDLLTPNEYIVFTDDNSPMDMFKGAVIKLTELVKTLTPKEKEYHYG